MKVTIDTRVPICPLCSGALKKGFKCIPGEYQGTYFFCTDCKMQYEIVGEGQSENELLCRYKKEG